MSRTQKLNPKIIHYEIAAHWQIGSVSKHPRPAKSRTQFVSSHRRTLQRQQATGARLYRPVKQIPAQYPIPFICSPPPLFSLLLRTFAACTFLMASLPGPRARRHLQMSSEIIFPVTSRCDCMKGVSAAFRNLHAPFPGRRSEQCVFQCPHLICPLMSWNVAA